MKYSTCLLVSTYNWPEALELIFLSITKQTILPDEIVIADDGSTEDTKKIVDKFKKIIQTPILHVWHKDEGFRKSVILNKAISKSNSDYIIEIDGDCILNKFFIEDHISLLKKNHFLYGSRVTLNKLKSQQILDSKKINISLFSKNINKRTRTLRIPFLASLFKPNNRLSKKVRGCNLSFFKSDFIAVNGYNEDIQGWGKEDSELVIRFLNKGCLGKRIRYKGIVYHLWHNENSKFNLTNNNLIQNKIRSEKIKWCCNGVDKYLK